MIKSSLIKKDDLWIVMPVYNEELTIGLVIEEWMQELNKYNINYTFCILNDGSKDKTIDILKHYASIYPQIYIVNKTNTGHGQTCIYGYRLAIEKRASWILQIDSDGQCDSIYFKEMFALRELGNAVFGIRVKRDDGFSRLLISRFVRVFTYCATGVWVKDANVPYRLMNTALLERLLDKVPVDFYLANILVSVLVVQKCKVIWVPIRFRDRQGGSPSIKTFSFLKHGIKLFRQLRSFSKKKHL